MAAASRLSRLILRTTIMPKQPPAPKHAPAIPLSGSMGFAFPSIPSLPVRTRTRTDVRAGADDQARADLITRYCFYAFMALDALGLAAAGYAIITM